MDPGPADLVCRRMKVAQQATPAPFCEEFDVILNLAIGNAWAGKVVQRTGVAAFKIDYLRVYTDSETVTRTLHGVKRRLAGAAAQRHGSFANTGQSDAR